MKSLRIHKVLYIYVIHLHASQDKCGVLNYCRICIPYADVLEKWEVPPINEVNRKLEKIEQVIKRQDDAIEELRFVCMH